MMSQLSKFQTTFFILSSMHLSYLEELLVKSWKYIIPLKPSFAAMPSENSAVGCWCIVIHDYPYCYIFLFCRPIWLSIYCLLSYSYFISFMAEELTFCSVLCPAQWGPGSYFTVLQNFTVKEREGKKWYCTMGLFTSEMSDEIYTISSEEMA